MNVAVNLAEDIYPVSSLEVQAKQLIEKIKQTKRPLILTEAGRSVAALIDIGEFQALRDQLSLMLDLLEITQAEQGPFTAHEQVKEKYSWLFEDAVDDITTD